MKEKIENTTRTARDNPMEMLVRTMMPGDIERMERAGTQQLAAASCYLPTKGTENRLPWETMGITFHEVKEDDPIFVRVTLPEGWKITTTDHDMWCNLRDAKGRIRAAMFYKAAFYDRSAHIRLTPRYHVETDYIDEAGRTTRILVKDQEGDRILWASETRTCPSTATREEREAFWRQCDHDDELARAWLTTQFPRWQDPLAYWD